MPNGDEGRAEFEAAAKQTKQTKPDYSGVHPQFEGDQAGPASNPPGEADEDRFSDEDKRTAKDFERAYAERHLTGVRNAETGAPMTEQDLRDMLAQAAVDKDKGELPDIPGEHFKEMEKEGERRQQIMDGHPSPHARHDKTEAHDMRMTSNVKPNEPVAIATMGPITSDPWVAHPLPDAREPNPLGWPDPAPWEDPMGKPKVELRVEPKVERKDTNPKDAVGIRKWRVFTTIPFTVIWELGVAMLEGSRKYGRHNYRVAGVRSSVYIDAAMGHLLSWWEGEDDDPDTGLSHIIKSIASLTVLRDAMIHGKMVDDRPPKTDVVGLASALQARVDDIFERIPEALPAYLEGDQYDDV